MRAPPTRQALQSSPVHSASFSTAFERRHNRVEADRPPRECCALVSSLAAQPEVRAHSDSRIVG